MPPEGEAKTRVSKNDPEAALARGDRNVLRDRFAAPQDEVLFSSGLGAS
jgi:hypothetical protein